MKSLIVGHGEVGKALESILKEYYPIEVLDLKKDKKPTSQQFDVLHICFKYSPSFEREVGRLTSLYKPKYTVIHSTVKVGTSRRLNAFHSPIRGKHPHLKESILCFVKLIGGENSDEIADYFRYCGIKVSLFRKQETTELAKLLDTLYYSVCIEFAKETEQLCKRYDVPFSEVYTLANQQYNEGYLKLGYNEYVRPVLQPVQRQIGGHCVLQNAALLEDCVFIDLIKKLNQKVDDK